MTVFQTVTISILAGLLLFDALQFLRNRGGRSSLVRGVVWLAAALAVYQPDAVSLVAQRIGIDRGADLVTYCFVLTYIATSFYFYSRYVRLRQELTELVRHQALFEANAQVDDRASH